MECAVCREPYKNPKLLPCGHQLCTVCLVAWVNSQGVPTCPLCRARIGRDNALTLGGGAPSTVADTNPDPLARMINNLPTDLITQELVHAESVLEKPRYCRSCRPRRLRAKLRTPADARAFPSNRPEPAVFLCLHCEEMLCDRCCLSHTAQHRLERFDKLTAEDLARMKPRTCEKHDNEEHSVFCPRHGMSVCQFCFDLEHQGCPGVVRVTEKVDKAQDVLQELKRKLLQTEKEVEEELHEVEQSLEKIDERMQETYAEIESQFNLLVQWVNACRVQLKTVVRYQGGSLTYKANASKELLVTRQYRLQAHRRMMADMAKYSHNRFFFDMVDMMRELMKELSCSAMLPPGFGLQTVNRVHFSPEELAHIREDLQKLGRPKTTPVDTTLRPVVLRWHGSVGFNVQLSEDRLSATRINSDPGCGIVMALEPMLTNFLYEVRIENVDDGYYITQFGLVIRCPHTFSRYDGSNLYSPNPYTLCVSHEGVWAFGGKILEKRRWLNQLPAGSRVGLAMSKQRSLYIYFNGQNKGLVVPHVPEPAYFAFDMFSRCKKITAMSLVEVEI